jgi:hypothetical protein
VGVGVVPVPEVVELPDDEPDDDDPEELEDDPEDAGCEEPEELGDALVVAVLVVLVDDAVSALEPPHPLMAKTATASVPTAQSSFKFNCNGEPFRRWGADSQAKLGEHLLWMYPVRVLGELQN